MSHDFHRLVSDTVPEVTGLTAAEAVEVVRKADEHQHEEQRDPDRGHALVDLTSDSTAAKPFDDREQDVAAVERQQRQQIQNRQREADQPENLQKQCEGERSTAWLETSTIPTGLETSFLPDPVTSLGKNVMVAFVAVQLVSTLWVKAPIGP